MSRNKNEKSIEDAAIRLAANAYVEKEGEKVMEEAKRLNQEKKVSDDQLAKFERFCGKEFAKQEWKCKLKQASKVAVAAVAVFVFVSGIHQFSMSYNNHIVDERGTITSENVSSKYIGDNEKEYAPTYLPETFITENIGYSVEKVKKYNFLSQDGQSIIFSYNKEETKNNETSNNDNAEIIDINGSQAKVTSKPDENIVTVTWEKGEHIFCVEAQGVDEDEVIKVAKSVQCVNED